MSPVVNIPNSFQECKILIDGFFSIRQEIIQENSQSINDHIRLLFSAFLVDISKQLGEFGDFCKSIQSKNINILGVNFNKLDQLRSVVQVIKYYQPVDQTIADLFAKTDKQFAVIYNIRACLFVQFRELEKAFADSTRAVEFDQDSPSSYTNYGIVYLELGLIDKAIEQFDKAISLSPNFKDAYLMSGRARLTKADYLMKRMGLKEEQLRELLCKFDNGFRLSDQEKEISKIVSLSASDFMRAVALSYNNCIEALLELGLLEYKCGYIASAIRSFSKVINIYLERKECFGEAYKYRALSYEECGLEDEAIEDCISSLNVVELHQPEIINALVRLLRKRRQSYLRYNKITGLSSVFTYENSQTISDKRNYFEKVPSNYNEIPSKDSLYFTCLDGTLGILGLHEENSLYIHRIRQWIRRPLSGFLEGFLDPLLTIPFSKMTRVNGAVVGGHITGAISIWPYSGSLNEDKAPKMIYNCHKNPVSHLLALSDNILFEYKDFLCVSFDRGPSSTLCLWSITTTTNKPTHTISLNNIRALDKIDEYTLVLGDNEGKLSYMNLKDFKIKGPFEIGSTNKLIEVVKSLKDGTFVIGYTDGALIRYHPLSGAWAQVEIGDDGTTGSDKKTPITVLEQFEDNHWVSGNSGVYAQVKVWNENNVCVRRFDANSTVTSLCVATGVIWIGCEDGTIHRWRPSLQKIVPLDYNALIKQYSIDVQKFRYELYPPDHSEHGTPKEVGTGSSTVYEGSYKNKSVAVKRILTPTIQKQKEAKKEIEVMFQLPPGCPSLVYLEGVNISFGSDGNPAIIGLVMELMEGTLNDLLTVKEKLSWEEKWVLMMDISYGLLCLHANQIVHRDLKPKNILIKNKRAKLCDMGSARQNMHSMTEQVAGTLTYVDPWFYWDPNTRKLFNEKCDIYSLGVILWEMLNDPHETPWKDIQGVQFKEKLMDRNEKLIIPNLVPPTMKTFLPDFWEKQRNKRPDATEVYGKISKIKDEFLQKDKQRSERGTNQK